MMENMNSKITRYSPSLERIVYISTGDHSFTTIQIPFSSPITNVHCKNLPNLNPSTMRSFIPPQDSIRLYKNLSQQQRYKVFTVCALKNAQFYPYKISEFLYSKLEPDLTHYLFLPTRSRKFIWGEIDKKKKIIAK